MANRFGRNQRRRLKRQLDMSTKLAINGMLHIIELEDAMRAQTTRLMQIEQQFDETKAALAAEIGDVWKLADGVEALVIPDSNVRTFRDTTEKEERGFSRTCEVELLKFDVTSELLDKLDQRFRTRALVSYRGVAWQIDDLIADNGRRDYGIIGGGRGMISEHVFTVRMSAVVTQGGRR